MRRLATICLITFVFACLAPAHAYAQSQRTPTVDADLEEMIGEGGVGSTREKAMNVWDLDEDPFILGQTINGHFESVDYMNFELRLNITYLFYLPVEGEQSDSDRVIRLGLTHASGISRDSALDVVDLLLPEDATLVSDWEEQPNTDQIRRYQSDAVEQILGELEIDGIDSLGTLTLLLYATPRGLVKIIEMWAGDLQ